MRFLADKPPLDAGGFALASAYAELSTTRAGGFGLMPIGIDRIWQWADENGVRDPYVRRHFKNVMLAIDAITVRRANDRQKTSSKPSPEPKSSGRRQRQRIKK